MDVNTGDLSQREFRDLSGICASKLDWKCEKTGYACKDYLCPIVASAKDVKEVREKFIKECEKD